MCFQNLSICLKICPERNAIQMFENDSFVKNLLSRASILEDRIKGLSNLYMNIDISIGFNKFIKLFNKSNRRKKSLKDFVLRFIVCGLEQSSFRFLNALLVYVYI